MTTEQTEREQAVEALAKSMAQHDKYRDDMVETDGMYPTYYYVALCVLRFCDKRGFTIVRKEQKP